VARAYTWNGNNEADDVPGNSYLYAPDNQRIGETDSTTAGSTYTGFAYNGDDQLLSGRTKGDANLYMETIAG